MTLSVCTHFDNHMDIEKDIYVDNPHINKIVTLHGKKWYHKSVDDKDIQYREFAVQKLLNKSGYVPNCINYNKSGFLEEKVRGRTFAEFEMITDKMLIALSGALQATHIFFEKNNHFDLFNESIINENRYDPGKVLNMVMGGVRSQSINDLGVDYDIINNAALELTSKIKNLPCRNTIIHGDVSLNNIILTPSESLYMIDWTDCRIDVGISDFSQAIHLMKLSQKQRNVLLGAYKNTFNFPLFVEFQLLMHGLYDLIAKLKKSEHFDVELRLLNKRIQEVKTIL